MRDTLDSPPGGHNGSVAPASATILLADDDERLQHFLTRVLERAGYRVVRAGNGDAVQSLVARHDPDLVLLELNLPRVSGFTILHGLQAFRRKPGVIVLTRSADEEDVIQALSSGADDYLTKPVQTRMLLAHVVELLRRVRGSAAQNDATERLSVGQVLVNASERTVSGGVRTMS